MDGTIGAARPSGISSVGIAVGSSVAAGLGHGGDIGTGFRSNQPLGAPVDTRNQYTENASTKTKLDASGEGSSNVSPSLPLFQRAHESPFTRYVSRNASKGTLPSGIPSFKPIDRTNMGIPLNPFWIRNDTWGMQHEADIFTDPTAYFVSPRVMSSGAQSSQNHYRKVYLDNKEQPQKGSGSSGMGAGSEEVPLEAAAGSVTGTGEASVQGEMAIDKANPAKTEAPEGSEEGSKLAGGDEGVPAKTKDSQDLGSDSKSTDNVDKEPPTKKAKTSRVKPQTGKAKKDPSKSATAE